MTLFVLKILLASFVIAFASWLANRETGLAGFVTALPLVSLLSLVFFWFETRDMGKVNAFAVSIAAAVPVSLVFFIPFFLNRWLKMNFIFTLCLALAFLAAAYRIHHFLLKWIR